MTDLVRLVHLETITNCSKYVRHGFVQFDRRGPKRVDGSRSGSFCAYQTVSCRTSGISEFPKWPPTFTAPNLHSFLIYSCFRGVQIFPLLQTSRIGQTQNGGVWVKRNTKPRSARAALLRLRTRSRYHNTAGQGRGKTGLVVRAIKQLCMIYITWNRRVCFILTCLCYFAMLRVWSGWFVTTIDSDSSHWHLLDLLTHGVVLRGRPHQPVVRRWSKYRSQIRCVLSA